MRLLFRLELAAALIYGFCSGHAMEVAARQQQEFNVLVSMPLEQLVQVKVDL